MAANKSILLLFTVLALLSAACLGEQAVSPSDLLVPQVTNAPVAKEINASEFMDMYPRGGFVLIDVRTQKEYNSGYIPGAVNIPDTELLQRISELNVSKSDMIVVYCEAGVRSKKGAGELLNAGYINVIDITDGMRGWRVIGGDIIRP